MEEDGDAFYVVRKGNVVGIYKNLSDCQAQASSSICDPSVSVYKGHHLKKESEDYLAARGLKTPLYIIDASDVKEELFGKLVLCPFQQPDGLSSHVDKAPKRISPQKREKTDSVEFTSPWIPSSEHPQKHPKSFPQVQPTHKKPEFKSPGSVSSEHPQKHTKTESSPHVQPIQTKHMSCIVEFDGASKGNPGKSGAGAILRAQDGSIICRLRQGLGVVTNNVAEYRSLILGLDRAHRKGYTDVTVRGDSQLVCLQVQGTWQTKNQNMSDLCKVVKGLEERFSSFQISHVRREFNADADAEANLAVDLPCGEIYEVS